MAREGGERQGRMEKEEVRFEGLRSLIESLRARFNCISFTRDEKVMESTEEIADTFRP